MYHIDMNSPALPSAALGANVGTPRIEYEAEPLEGFDHERIVIASWGQYQTLDQMRASPYYVCIRLPICSDTIIPPPLFPDPSSSCESAMVRPIVAGYESSVVYADQAQPEQHVTLHAVHSIPTRYLRSLAQDQLEFLSGYWTEKRFQPDGDLARRMLETVEAIGQIMHEKEEAVM